MAKAKPSRDDANDLRRQAERKVRPADPSLAEMSQADIAAALHELQVHQVELEMQNDELRKAQAELEESRTRYADLFDFAPVGYVVLDREGMVVEANLTAASLLGRERRRLIDQPLTRLVASADRDAFRHHYDSVFKTDRPQELQVEMRQEEGRPRQVVRLRSRPVTDGTGKVIQCRTTITDVTGLASAEQRLKDSERRFRTLAENSPDIITRMGKDLRVTYVNSAVRDAFGVGPEELVGHTFEEMDVPETLRTLWADKIRRVFATGKPAQFDFDADNPRGVGHYSAVLVPEFGDEGAFSTILITVRDVTDRVHAEEKYGTIIRSLQDGFCIVDTEGRYVEVNEAYARMLGRSIDELQHVKVWDVVEPGLHDELRNHVQKAFGQGWDKFPITHRRKDGSDVDCDVTLQRLNGNRLFVFARDTTQRRLADRRRQETLQRLDLVMRAANDGIWDYDPTTQTLWHNTAFAAAFGYDPQEISKNLDWWEHRIHPDDHDRVIASLEQAIHGDAEIWSERYRLRRKDGAYAWVVDRGIIVRDDRGDLVRVVGSTMDLTEKLELVGRLESERGKLATILDTAQTGIVVVDAQARITYSNRVAQELYHCPMPFGEPFGSCKGVQACYADGRPCAQEDMPLVRSALHGETFNEISMIVKEPAGRSHHLLVNSSPVLDAEGRVTGGVAVLHDVTELKQAEQALREARDQLEERVRERTAELDAAVETLHEEVAEKIEAQDRLSRQNETLQKIVNSIPVMLCFYDDQGNVGMVNDEFMRVLGYTAQDLKDHKVLELCYPDPAYRREVWAHMIAAEPGWRDFLVQSKDGDKIVSAWASIHLSDGTYLAIGIDVRERRRFEDRIRESEERYRTLVELSPDAIAVEREGIIQFVNTTAVKLLGARAGEELVGRPILDLMHADYRSRAERQFTYLRRRRPLPPSEDRIVRLDGTPVDVEMAAMPILFEGRPANQIVLRDITQRKQVEARLQENAKQLQQQAELLNLAHDSIVVNDLDGRVVFWNRGAEQTYGWTREEAVGRIIHDLLQTQFPSNLIEITTKLLSQGRWNGELTHTTKDGRTIVVSSRWALQRGEGSLPTGILVIDRDVTLQKQAERAMMEAQRFAESITDTVQESLLVLDRDLQVVSANQTFYRVFQVEPNETHGRYLYEIGNGQWDLPQLRPLLEDILPHNTSFDDFEVEHEFERIGRRTMLLNARRIHQRDQETEMILLAILDITIRKEQEKKIREHQQKLASLTEELLLAEERERHRIALVLHDSIGQSLAFSKRELGVLQKKSPESVRQGLEYVKEQIDLAVRQTRDLTFELSPTTLHTFGLEAAVEELVEQLAAHENLRYHFETTEDDKPLTEQIRTLLYRATRELLLNIVKHANARNVSICIDRQNKNVRMVIEDDGKGFDVSQLQRTARQQEGFGLFSIRERLTYVGGKFTIESQPGRGTKVTLVAPLNRENLVKSRSGKP
jgi:PAS domain S-box-containing protein